MAKKYRKEIIVRRGKKVGDFRARRRRKVRKKINQADLEGLSDPNVRRRQVKKTSGTAERSFSIPPVFSLLRNHDETLKFFNDLEIAFDDKNTFSIEVDHSKIQEIDIEACLLLIAQFSRLTAYSPNVRLRSKLNGISSSVSDLLDGIGYFRFYDRQKPRAVENCNKDTVYSAVRTGKGTDSVASGTLVSLFSTEGYLDSLDAKRLGKCLVECLDNVSHHAYKGNVKKPLKKRWWLVGYCDKKSDEIYFAILDLGVGMPKTLNVRRRQADSSIKQLLFGLNDEELIVKAFTSSLSSTKKPNRGLGLPGLKKIIGQLGAGELRVFTKRSECRIVPNGLPSGKRHKYSLGGTMLTWRLKRKAKTFSP